MATVASQPPVAPAAASPAHRHTLALFIGRRVAAGVATLLVVSAFIFFATQVLPGSVAQIVLGRSATPAAITQLDERLHLNRPIVDRYLSWLEGAATLDFGNSAVQIAQGAQSAPVASEISQPLRNSLILAGFTVVLLIPLSALLGVFAATRAGRPSDYAVSLTSVIVGAFPEFVFGTLLIVVFFSWLHLLPPLALIPPGDSPFQHLKELILPVLTLLGVTLAAGIRQVRAGMIDVLRRDYVAVAQINGISRRRILWRYGLRNALPAAVQITAQNIQYLLGGIIIVESVFAYPGLGTFLVNAVNVRDVTQVEAVALILATAYIAINIVADVAVVLLVPKLRTDL